MNRRLLTAVLLSFLLLPGYDSGKLTEDIYIIYTNDVASAIDENFGYAGVKGYKDMLKEEYCNRDEVKKLEIEYLGLKMEG